MQYHSPFPAGVYKTARNRQDSMTDKHGTQITKKDPQKKHCLRTVSIFLLDGLNMFDCINLTLISDVDLGK